MARLEIVHDVTRQPAGHGHDGGDEEQLHLRHLGERRHDEQHDEAEDLHGVDARLPDALRAHGAGDEGKQNDRDAHERAEAQRH